MSTTDNLIRQALLEAADRELAQLDAEELSFSEDYLLWEKKFLQDPQGMTRKKLRPLWSRALRTAACFLLVVSLSFGAVMVGSPQARAWVRFWVVDWQEDHVTYQYEGESLPTEALQDWKPTYLPEGYEQTDYIDLPGVVSILYNNEDPDMQIEFSYMLLTDGSGYGLDNERHKISDVSVNGLPGNLFIGTTNDDGNMLTWMDPVNHTNFLLMSRVSCDTLIQIAESVVLVK